MGILDRFRRKKSSPPKEGGLPREGEKVTPKTPQEEAKEREAWEIKEKAMKEVKVDEGSVIKEVVKKAGRAEVETVPMEEDNIPKKSSVKEAIVSTLVHKTDHKNWSGNLATEQFFKNKRQAKAYASYARSQGFYAKLVKVKGGYKVYVYKQGGGRAKGIILHADTKGLSKLKKFDTKTFSMKSTNASKMQSKSFALPKIDFNFGGLESFKMEPFNIDFNMESFDFNFNRGFDLDFDMDWGIFNPKKRKEVRKR